MKNIKNEVVELSIKDILPDENQPRKYFDPVKIATLRDSIKKYGIMNPVSVEKIGNGYILVDGERRYRAATEIGLKTIPAIILEPQSKVDRLVQQFHLQEQHEEWTPVEKAQTVHDLSLELGVSILELSRMLGIAANTASRYEAFGGLLEKKDFEKSEISLEYARPIKLTILAAEKIYHNDLKEVFDQPMKRKLEKAIINRIKAGDINKYYHISKIKDSFRKDPKMIEKFMSGNLDINEMFLKSKAQGERVLRQIHGNAKWLQGGITKFLENPDAHIKPEYISTLKNLRSKIDDLLTKIQD